MVDLWNIHERMQNIEKRGLYMDQNIIAINEAKAELKELCELIQFFAFPPGNDDVEPSALIQMSYDIQDKYGWAPYRGMGKA